MVTRSRALEVIVTDGAAEIAPLASRSPQLQEPEVANERFESRHSAHFPERGTPDQKVSAEAVGEVLGPQVLERQSGLGNVTEAAGYPLVDNVMRFLGAVMFALGLGFIYSLFDVQNKTVFFRFLLLAIFLGGLARLLAWSQSGVVLATIPSTAIELIFPPLMYYLQSRLTAGT